MVPWDKAIGWTIITQNNRKEEKTEVEIYLNYSFCFLLGCYADCGGPMDFKATLPLLLFLWFLLLGWLHVFSKSGSLSRFDLGGRHQKLELVPYLVTSYF